MRGIDISHWNGWPFGKVTEAGYKQSDFVIVKATQGTAYASYTGYFEKAIKRVLDDGKLAGAYHYAAGNNAEKEADYFLSVVKPYIGKIILALDWEPGDNKAWGSKTWARLFVNRVHDKTGIWPLIYTGMEGCVQCASCASDCALWFAGYPTSGNSWTVPKWPAKYTIAPWKAYSIWQFTSGKGALDRNTSPLSKTKWAALTGSGAKPGKPKETVKNETGKVSSKTTLQLAVEVMQGKHGQGADRKKSLGSRYKEVQAFINYIAIAPALELAKETISGKFGNDNTRKVVLGKRFAEVQKLVNKLKK